MARTALHLKQRTLAKHLSKRTRVPFRNLITATFCNGKRRLSDVFSQNEDSRRRRRMSEGAQLQASVPQISHGTSRHAASPNAPATIEVSV